MAALGTRGVAASSHSTSRGRARCAAACTATRPRWGHTPPSCTQRAPSHSGECQSPKKHFHKCQSLGIWSDASKWWLDFFYQESRYFFKNKNIFYKLFIISFVKLLHEWVKPESCVIFPLVRPNLNTFTRHFHLFQSIYQSCGSWNGINYISNFRCSCGVAFGTKFEMYQHKKAGHPPVKWVNVLDSV